MMLARATPSAVPQKATSMATAADATPAGLPESERIAVELRGVTVRYKGIAALSSIETGSLDRTQPAPDG